MNEPAGMLTRMSTAYNAYTLWMEYKGAKNKAGWARANPDKWESVTWIMAKQKESKNG